MKAFWRVLTILGVALLFIAAVLSSTQNVTVGLGQSALLLALALIGVRYFRADRKALLKSAFICIVAGVIIRPWGNPIVQVLSDSLIALAVTIVAVYLVGPPMARLVRRIRFGVHEGRELFARPAGAVAEQALAIDSAAAQTTAVSQWTPFLIGAVLMLVLLLVGSGRFVGVSAASLQWNVHLFTSDLWRVGPHLNDPTLLAFGSATFVAIPDSLALSVLKVVDPHAWATYISNLLTLLSVGLFVFASVRFLQQLSFDWPEAVAATVLFLLLPIGMELRFAAPFDLSVPLLALLPALSKRAGTPLFLGAAFLSGVCNTANGYEYAVLLVGLRAFKVVRLPVQTATYVLAAALAIVGSIAASVLLNSAAPAASLREAWWYAQEIPRIVWAEQLAISWPAIVIFAAVAAAGMYAMLRARLFRLVSPVCALAIASALLAVPTTFGGVPLLSVAHVLQAIAPAGWPTARFVELLAFVLVIPVAYAVSLILRAFERRRPRVRAAVVWVAAAIIFIMCLPSAHSTGIPQTPPGATVVEFPIAEAGSRAGVLYAEDLLAARARVLQPLIFMDRPAPLQLRSSPADPSTVRTMREANVKLVVLRSDIYAQPAWRTVEPRLYDPAFSAQPALAAVYPWKVMTYTPAGLGM